MPLETTVVYLMSGQAHLPYLVVSLNSLRRHWKGHIRVYAYPDSIEIANLVGEDKRLGIEVVEWKPVYRGKNGQFLNKICLAQRLGSAWGIYLDADTLIKKPITEISARLHESPVVLTQWNDWICCGGMPRNRIKRLEDRPHIPQQFVRRLLHEPALPSVNGGVFGFWSGSSLLTQWERYTRAVLDTFIADEVALHTLVAEYEHSHELEVITGGHMNCSPKYKPKKLDDRDVHIWHFHGDSNCRPNKSPRGVGLWWPEYQYCLQENIGGIADWRHKVKNKHLRRLEETPEDDTCIYCWGNCVDGHRENCPLAEGVDA